MSPRPLQATTGAAPRLVAALAFGWPLVWVAWPLWASGSAADSATLGAEFGWVLIGLLGLMLLLGVSLWRHAGRTLRPFAAAAPLVLASVATTTLLHPGGSGVEFAFAFPLLAGVLLGGPAGLLTGMSSGLLSALINDTVATPLIGQALVWGLWGLAGGLFSRASNRGAAASCVVASLPLGIVSGALLNLTGWPAETSAEGGSFLPGLSPWESLLRLATYTWSTSFGYDLTRAITTAVLLALLAYPVITLLRQVHDARPLVVEVAPLPRVRIPLAALARRDRSDQLANLWNTVQGDPDE